MIQVKRTHLYWLLQSFGWSAYIGLILFASINSKGFYLNSSFLINLVFSFFLGILFSHLLKIRVLSMGLLKLNGIRDFLKTILLLITISLFYVISTKIISIIVSWSFVNIGVLSFIINWSSYLLLFAFWLTLYYVYFLFEQNRRQEIDNLALKAFQSELELHNLRSQLNPHFLFNALNAIRALIEVDPKKSKEAVTLLSNMLRFSLSTSYDRLISLENELQMVDSYLRLEKIRFEQRLDIKKEINDDLKSFNIPAFTIQTLIENAIKHGISKLIEGGEISIRVDLDREHVLIQVANSGIFGNEIDLGISLSNLKKRLELEYGNNYTFSIYQADMVFVEIRIPTNR
ncbi:MAG: histidine kinase [Bacteroidetes bacterium]|nr:histidine kinase [Bacteroidota bacterium]